MDNFSPKRTTKAHIGRHMDRLASIGMGFSANSVRWDNGGDAVAEAAAAKEAFIGSLPETVRGNEALKSFSNVGELATAFIDTSTKLAAKPAATWKGNLTGDLGKSPLLQKFDDTPDGLNKAFESHIGLEKLLGHEKVPIPKGPEDTEGWARFSKALGIPDKAEEYGLPDVNIPETMKGMAFDKKTFAEIVHSQKLTPSQAKGLWKVYSEGSLQAYSKALESHKVEMTKVVNQLKSEWGDAYDANVELGQMVINKFSTDKETADEISAALLGNPKAIKFLAKIGEQFAENKVGDFGYKRFGLSPEQAKEERDKILKDPNHPYTNPKASPKEHEAAIDYMNRLYAIIIKAQG